MLTASSYIRASQLASWKQRRIHMRSVVVTGVSTGIGWGTAKVLIGHGLHVFGSVRKQADADRLAQEFGSAFTPLLFDMSVTKIRGMALGCHCENLRFWCHGRRCAPI